MINLNKIFKTLPKEGYAVLDFDNTCIINDVGEALFAFLCENQLLKNIEGKSAFQKYFRLLEEGKVEEAYEFQIKILGGFTLDELKRIVREIIRHEGSEITKRKLFGIKIPKGIRINESVLKIVDFLQTNNYKIWVVTASHKTVVEEALKIFFPTYKINCIGMENEIEKGILTDRLIYPTSMFKGKVEAIKKYISRDIKPILAIGDSMSDQYMLEYAKIGIIINKNKKLVDLAKEKGWIVL